MPLGKNRYRTINVSSIADRTTIITASRCNVIILLRIDFFLWFCLEDWIINYKLSPRKSAFFFCSALGMIEAKETLIALSKSTKEARNKSSCFVASLADSLRSHVINVLYLTGSEGNISRLSLLSLRATNQSASLSPSHVNEKISLAFQDAFLLGPNQHCVMLFAFFGLHFLASAEDVRIFWFAWLKLFLRMAKCKNWEINNDSSTTFGKRKN